MLKLTLTLACSLISVPAIACGTSYLIPAFGECVDLSYLSGANPQRAITTVYNPQFNSPAPSSRTPRLTRKPSNGRLARPVDPFSSQPNRSRGVDPFNSNPTAPTPTGGRGRITTAPVPR